MRSADVHSNAKLARCVLRWFGAIIAYGGFVLVAGFVVFVMIASVNGIINFGGPRGF